VVVVMVMRVCLILVSAVGLTLLPAARAAAFCEDGAGHRCAEEGLPPLCHTEITNTALAFMRPAPLANIVEGNLHMDHEHKNARWEHSDGCLFEETGRNLNYIYANPEGSGEVDRDFFVGICLPFSCDLPHGDDRSVVGFLDPGDPAPLLAARVFGFASHPIQDFYSHSNWLETFERRGVLPDDIPLMEPSVDLWRGEPWEPLIVEPGILATLGVDAVVLAQDDVYGDRPFDGPLQNPVVNVDGARYAAIFTDTNLGADDECVPGMGANHDTINKDNPCEMDSFYHPVSDHYAAAQLATRQTAHEWCRIQNLTREKWGISGVTALRGLWIDPNAAATGLGSPHPPGTPCEPSPPGSAEISVDIDQIRVLNDREELGRLNFSLEIFSHDLTRSVRDEVNGLGLNQSDPVVGDGLAPGPLTICLTEAQANASVASVQGWADVSGGEFNSLDGSDQVLQGLYGEIEMFSLGVHTVASDDLEVTFDIRHSPTDLDEDGLFRCDEEMRGTNPDDADTDDDGTSDGAEIAAGSDPLVGDSDGDGSLDGVDNCPLAANAGQEDYEADGLGDACDPDDDNDSVPDVSDAFPHSNLDPTVVVFTCDSHVANDHLFPNGATFNDQIGRCRANSRNYLQFVLCASHLAYAWEKADLISNKSQWKITACVVRAPLRWPR
jgi:hypothetical protein